jgi:septal ring factor EnvC (AmiA/AmiB activator)
MRGELLAVSEMELNRIKILTILSAAAVALGLLAGGPAGVAVAHDPDRVAKADLSRDIKKEKKELQKLKKNLEAEKRKRRAARRKEKSILSALESSDRNVTLKRRELSSINRKLRSHTKSAERLEGDIRSLQEDVDSKKDRVRSQVRKLYQQSRLSNLGILFASADYYDFLKRYYYLSLISQKENRLLSSYRTALDRLGDKQEKMESAQKELLNSRREVAAKLREVKAEKRKKGRILASVRKDSRLHEQAIEELEDSANRVTGLIQRLEKKRKTSLSAGAFFRAKGRLDWPTAGKVVAFFGRQKHPKFGTLINKKGIEIRSRLGEPIRSIYGGKVAFADWFKGFGLLVIIDHGNNYFSLYAHAAKLMVSAGDRVKTHQIIGQIGETGLTGDANLYFEIRKGAEAVNPLTWLKKR